MIPTTGSMEVLSQLTLTATNLTGTLTGTSTATSTLLLVSTTVVPAALDGIRTAAGLYLNDADFPVGTRIVDKFSPVTYPVTGAAWAAGVCTLTCSGGIPLQAMTGHTFKITGALNTQLNGTYITIGIGATNTFGFSLAADPLTGFTGASIRPGIVDVLADGTGVKAMGYYTINRPANNTVSAAALSTTLRTPFLSPSGTTHIIAKGVTAADITSLLIFDVVGQGILPCLNLVCHKNLKGGQYFMANGVAAGDVSILTYCRVNPTG